MRVWLISCGGVGAARQKPLAASDIQEPLYGPVEADNAWMSTGIRDGVVRLDECVEACAVAEMNAAQIDGYAGVVEGIGCDQHFTELASGREIQLSADGKDEFMIGPVDT